MTPKNQSVAEVTRDTRGSLSFGGQRVMNLLLVGGANNDDTFFGVPLDGLLGAGLQFGKVGGLRSGPFRRG